MDVVLQDLLLTFTDLKLLFGHFTYLLLIVSMLMRRIVWLRSIAIAAGISKVIYRIFFVFDPVSVLWESMFVLVNAGELAATWWQYRPLQLRDEEQQLIETLAPNLSRRATRALLAKAEWRSAAPGETLTTEGAVVGGLIYIADGGIDIVVAGGTVGMVSAGELLGEITWEDGEAATATAIARTPVRYVWFDGGQLRHTLRRLEILRYAVQASISRDLMRKLVRTTHRTEA
jgi:hypothetical protein